MSPAVLCSKNYSAHLSDDLVSGHLCARVEILLGFYLRSESTLYKTPLVCVLFHRETTRKMFLHSPSQMFRESQRHSFAFLQGHRNSPKGANRKPWFLQDGLSVNLTPTVCCQCTDFILCMFCFVLLFCYQGHSAHLCKVKFAGRGLQ